MKRPQRYLFTIMTVLVAVYLLLTRLPGIAGIVLWAALLLYERQAYFGRRVTITRNWVGMMSSRCDVSSPMTCIVPAQHGQALLVGSTTSSTRGRWFGSAPRLHRRFCGSRFAGGGPLGQNQGLERVDILGQRLGAGGFSRRGHAHHKAQNRVHRRT